MWPLKSSSVIEIISIKTISLEDAWCIAPLRRIQILIRVKYGCIFKAVIVSVNFFRDIDYFPCLPEQSCRVENALSYFLYIAIGCIYVQNYIQNRIDLQICITWVVLSQAYWSHIYLRNIRLLTKIRQFFQSNCSEAIRDLAWSSRSWRRKQWAMGNNKERLRSSEMQVVVCRASVGSSLAYS